RDPIGTLGAVMVLFVILVAVLANLIAPYDPVAQITKPLQPPNNIFLLGTDEFGRDVLSRIIHGSRVSLYVGVVAVAIALLRRAGARRRQPLADLAPHPAEHRRADHRPGDGRLLDGDPDRGYPELPRPRHPAADPVVGHYAQRRQAVRLARAVDLGLSRPRHR